MVVVYASGVGAAVGADGFDVGFYCWVGVLGVGLAVGFVLFWEVGTLGFCGVGSWVGSWVIVESVG